MTSHLEDTELLDAAFGMHARLSDEQRLHARTCVVCQRGLQLVTEFVAPAIETSLRGGPPTAALPAPPLRLMASVDRLEKYTPYAGVLGDVLEVSRAEARRYLHTLDDESSWEASWISGSSHRFVELDLPAFTGGHAMVFRLGPGAVIPEHRHHGEERCLLLEGQLLVDHVLHHGGDLDHRPRSQRPHDDGPHGQHMPLCDRERRSDRAARKRSKGCFKGCAPRIRQLMTNEWSRFSWTSRGEGTYR